MLIALSTALLIYKALLRYFPFLARPWWHYRYTMMLLGACAWMLIYRYEWRWPATIFVIDYGIFLLRRRSALPGWLGVLLTLVPLFGVKTGVLPFMELLGLSF